MKSWNWCGKTYRNHQRTLRTRLVNCNCIRGAICSPLDIITLSLGRKAQEAVLGMVLLSWLYLGALVALLALRASALLVSSLVVILPRDLVLDIRCDFVESVVELVEKAAARGTMLGALDYVSDRNVAELHARRWTTFSTATSLTVISRGHSLLCGLRRPSCPCRR